MTKFKMKPFEYFLEREDIKKGFPDKSLARSLIKDMNNRINDVLSLDISKFPKLVFENTYDALRDFADAILAADGYKSYSHEASLVYLEKYDFEEPILHMLDKFRYRRNGSKYYGQVISVEEAKEIFNFYNKIKNRINTILKNKGLL